MPKINKKGQDFSSWCPLYYGVNQAQRLSASLSMSRGYMQTPIFPWPELIMIYHKVEPTLLEHSAKEYWNKTKFILPVKRIIFPLERKSTIF